MAQAGVCSTGMQTEEGMFTTFDKVALAHLNTRGGCSDPLTVVTVVFDMFLLLKARIYI